MPLVSAPLMPGIVPLAEVYRRLGEVSPLVRIVLGSAQDADARRDGRLSVAEPGAVDELVAAEERRITDAYGTVPRRDVAATWALQRYAFTACLAMSGPWYLERRIPRLSWERVAWDWRDRELTVEPEGVTCLAGDPLEGLPGVSAVPDEEALRAELRAAVAAHLAPVLDAFRPVLRRGPRALWATATDQLTSGIWHLGRALGETRAATDAANALLPGSTMPFTGGAGFRPSAELGGEPTRTRNNCCFFYTIRPDDLCATCPRSC